MAVDRDQLFEPLRQIACACRTDDSSLSWAQLALEPNRIGLTWTGHFVGHVDNVPTHFKSLPKRDAALFRAIHTYIYVHINLKNKIVHIVHKREKAL